MNSLLTYAEENSGGSSMFTGLLEIASIVGLWMMFQKADEPGWKAIIPFYNEYTLCKKVMNDGWYWLRLFVGIIPVIGWIAFLYFQYQIGKATARAYGQPDSWAWGYTFLSPVFYCLTGFGSYSYYGPMGLGDRRTDDARSAKTVDFEVTKSETPAAEPAVKAAPAEPEVKAVPVEPEVKAVPVEPEVKAVPVEPEVKAAPASESGSVEFEFENKDETAE